jgi:hypothetical protein
MKTLVELICQKKLYLVLTKIVVNLGQRPEAVSFQAIENCDIVKFAWTAIVLMSYFLSQAPNDLK